MFLRTSEFLWQEGHTAHETHVEAQEEVARMLAIYADFSESFMAMPVIRGRKTQSEKFAGALESYCIEAMMQDGKALQAGTSHDLGQNFGRAFDVKYQNREGQWEHVWQTSWGVSTRLVGGLIMTHADDRGLVLPPKLAPVQVAIVPIIGKGANEDEIFATGQRICDDLKSQGIAAVFDKRDHKPGFKFFEWEQKGVPLRLELGQRDIAAGHVMAKTRIEDGKKKIPFGEITATVESELDRLQAALLQAARDRLIEQSVTVDSYDEFRDIFAGNSSKFVYAHWDGTDETEAQVKAETKATIRCIPLGDDQFGGVSAGNCIVTGRPSERRVLFAKAY